MKLSKAKAKERNPFRSLLTLALGLINTKYVRIAATMTMMT